MSNGVGFSKIVRGLSRMCHELLSGRCLFKGIISVLWLGPGTLFDNASTQVYQLGSPNIHEYRGREQRSCKGITKSKAGR